MRRGEKPRHCLFVGSTRSFARTVSPYHVALLWLLYGRLCISGLGGPVDRRELDGVFFSIWKRGRIGR